MIMVNDIQGTRKKLEVEGFVVSDKMQKTITVRVQRALKHKKYGKYLMRATDYRAHDDSEQAKEGDKVLIRFARPLSKTKRWNLVKVIEKAKV